MKRIVLIILTACILISATSCSVMGTGNATDSVADSKPTVEEVYDELVYLLKTYGEKATAKETPTVEYFIGSIFQDGRVSYTDTDNLISLSYYNLDLQGTSFSSFVFHLYIDEINIKTKKFDWTCEYTPHSGSDVDLTGVLDGETFSSRTTALESSTTTANENATGNVEQLVAEILHRTVKNVLIPLLEKSEKITLEDIGFTRYQ